MREFLLCQVYGPLASWGDAAVGEVRGSFGAPSKSAALGLLASALGITRAQEQAHAALARGLAFGVCVTHPGSALIDYHTAQVPHGPKGRDLSTRRDELRAPKLNTVLSSRHYLRDSAAILAFWHAPHAADVQEVPSLAQLEAALREPRFALYLGRKSCPLAMPMHPQRVSAPTLREALERADFSANAPFLEALTRHAPLSAPKAARWEVRWEGEEADSGFKATQTLRRADALLSRRRWQFGTREESVCMWTRPAPQG